MVFIFLFARISFVVEIVFFFIKAACAMCFLLFYNPKNADLIRRIIYLYNFEYRVSLGIGTTAIEEIMF